MKIGKNNTFYGNVPIPPYSEIGDNNTFVGPTDAQGNVRIPSGTAAGFGAYADRTSIALGAHAGAGINLQTMLQEVGNAIPTTGDSNLVERFNEFCREINNPQINKAKAKDLWERFCEYARNVAAWNGATELFSKIARYFS